MFGREDYFQIIYSSAMELSRFNFTRNTVFVYSPVSLYLSLDTQGDCHEDRCIREIKPNMDILAFRYAFEPLDMFHYARIKKLRKTPEFSKHHPQISANWFPLMYHSNECSQEEIFYPSRPSNGGGWASGRKYDVRLFGQVKFPFYPCACTASSYTK